MKTDIVTAVPPLGVTTLTFAGLPLQQWVYVVTIVYTLLMIAAKLPVALRAMQGLWRKWKERNE